VTIRVDDGNGGFALQTFTLTVDVPTNELPIEARPTTNPLILQSNFGPTHTGQEGTDQLNQGGLLGLTNAGNEERWLLSHQSSGTHPGSGISTGTFLPGATLQEELGGGPHGQNLLEPELNHLGSEPPITPLTLYAPEIVRGKRLHFNAEEVQLWNLFDLHQPSLDIAGSEDLDTPLEGYGAAVELGRRLNFNYNPIQDVLSLNMDDLRVSDLLGL